MGAVIAVLNENLTESLKGFYKLRKAYVILRGLIQAEQQYRASRSQTASSAGSVVSLANSEAEQQLGKVVETSPQTAESLAAARNAETQQAIPIIAAAEAENGGNEDDDNDSFEDAYESLSGADGTDFSGPPGMSALEEDFSHLNVASGDGHLRDFASIDFAKRSLDLDAEFALHGNPVDVFIRSGSNLCFGVLLVMLSMIPPVFGKLLSIIGFKGDRAGGLQLLWNATRFSNINGAMAGLMLLGYYNGVASLCDILPDDDAADSIDGYPKKRCEELLADMRSQYPKSHLWLLEEARMRAANQNLEEAVDLLSGPMKTQLRQLEALAVFELSLNAMFSHQYELASESFVKVNRANVRILQ